jgi:putative endonuclease
MRGGTPMNRKELGRWGEEMASQYLIHEKGYHIIDRNYRCPIGEIDLVAIYQKTLIFIEVKTRRFLSFGLPAESVTRNKQRKYHLLSQYYMKEKGLYDLDCRFDIVEVFARPDGSCNLNHIINAF